MSNGKGSAPRPLSVTPSTYAANYARIQWTERTPLPAVEWQPLGDTEGLTDAEIEAKLLEYIAKQPNAILAAMPFVDVDTREPMRQANLEHAKRVILGTPCHDPAPRPYLLWHDPLSDSTTLPLNEDNK